jgi:hypothetical protein
MFAEMKRLAVSLIAVTLAASACGSSHPSTIGGLDSAAYRALPQSLRVAIRSELAKPNDGPTHEIDVYGPGAHAALERAAMGDIVRDPLDVARKKDFYVTVQHGQYVCNACAGPGAGKPVHGTVETSVLSANGRRTDWGIGGTLPATMSRLHHIAVITVS